MNNNNDSFLYKEKQSLKQSRIQDKRKHIKSMSSEVSPHRVKFQSPTPKNNDYKREATSRSKTNLQSNQIKPKTKTFKQLKKMIDSKSFVGLKEKQ